MARTKKEVEETKDEIDWTVMEMIDFENNFKVPFSELSNKSVPRTAMVAYCGYLKRRRVDPQITYRKYLELNLSLEDLYKEAFDLDDDDIDNAAEKVAEEAE